MLQYNKRWCWLVYTILIYLYSSNYWCWTNSELSRQVDLLRGLILSMLQFAIVWVSLNQERTIFFWFSQYIQVWSSSRWRHFTNGSEMGAANLDSWGPRETAIKHYKFTTTVYLKNIIIWCRYCAAICTESTSFCEHNFGNQEHNLGILA